MAAADTAPTPAPTLAQNLRRVLGHPGTRQILSLVGIALAIAIGITMWFWSQTPGLAPLFSGLTTADEMSVAQALESRGVRYETAANGTVLVPSAQVHELRLAMAAEGLPRAAGVGFESMQDTGALGSSPFMENARYQHALETELARTIANMQSIRSARVHLATPRRSAFVRSEQKASAAVMLSLYPGRELDSGQVAAIVHLVSSSVPALSDDRVSVVDQRGTLLSRPTTAAGQGMDTEQLAYQDRLEQRYVQRILQLLQPLAGPGNVSAQVTVDLDLSRSEQTREVYDPQSRTIRSEQTMEERGGGSATGGVPGALSNRPPEEAVAAEPDSAAPEMRSLQATRNYEINRVVEQTWRQPGQIRRISAAVVVDHLPNGEEGVRDALDAEKMERIEALVREAIGFSAERGDSVNVQNLRFQAPELDPVADVPLWEDPMVWDLGRQLLGLLVLLFVAFRLFKPAIATVLKTADQPALGRSTGTTLAVENSEALPAPAGAPGGQGAAPNALTQAQVAAQLGVGPQTGADGQNVAAQQGEFMDPNAITPGMMFEDKLGSVRQAVTQDPAKVAQVVKGWLASE